MWMNPENSKLLVETMKPIAEGKIRKVINISTNETIDYTVAERETASKIVKYAEKYVN